MTASKISITRALAELKTLDARIASLTDTSKFIGIAVKNVVNGGPVDVYSAKAKAALQSLNDLISRRDSLKCAIVLSNASTPVQIGSKTYKVAEAIERKNSIAYQQALVNTLRAQRQTAKADMERTNQAANATLNTLIGGLVSKEGTVSESDIEAVSRPYRENNFATLVDPLSIDNEIEKMDAEISEFLLNVDFSLSEINAVTTITV